MRFTTSKPRIPSPNCCPHSQEPIPQQFNHLDHPIINEYPRIKAALHERTLLDDKSVLLCMQALLEVAASQSAPRRLPTKSRLSRWFNRKRVSPENNMPSAASLTPTLSRETSLASSTTMSDNVSTAPSTPPKPPKRSKSNFSVMFSKIGKKFNNVINRQGSKQQLIDDEQLVSLFVAKKASNNRLLMDKDGACIDFGPSPSLTISQSVLDTKEKEVKVATAHDEKEEEDDKHVTEAQQIAHIWREENADFGSSLADPSISELSKGQESLNLDRHSQQEETMQSSDIFENMSSNGSVESSTGGIIVDHDDGLKHDFSLDDFAHYNRMMAQPLHDIAWQEKFHVEQKDEQKMYMTVKSVVWALYRIISHNHAFGLFRADPCYRGSPLFTDEDPDGSRTLYNAKPVTTYYDILNQIAYILDCGDLVAEHVILAFVYIHRMLENSRQHLCDVNWRLIVLLGFLIAVKVWDDCAVFNMDFVQIFPELTVELINATEKRFLQDLDYNVACIPPEFARTYQDLQALLLISPYADLQSS